MISQLTFTNQGLWAENQAKFVTYVDSSNPPEFSLLCPRFTEMMKRVKPRTVIPPRGAQLLTSESGAGSFEASLCDVRVTSLVQDLYSISCKDRCACLGEEGQISDLLSLFFSTCSPCNDGQLWLSLSLFFSITGFHTLSIIPRHRGVGRANGQNQGRGKSNIYDLHMRPFFGSVNRACKGPGYWSANSLCYFYLNF